jgi:hypothetical protein
MQMGSRLPRMLTATTWHSRVSAAGIPSWRLRSRTNAAVTRITLHRASAARLSISWMSAQRLRSCTCMRWHCRLTVRPSRHRFAVRLNSGVRRHWPVAMFRHEGRLASCTHRTASRLILLFAPGCHALSDGLGSRSFARVRAARLQLFWPSGRLRMPSPQSCSKVPAVAATAVGHYSPLPPNYSSKPTPLRSSVEASCSASSPGSRLLRCGAA